MGAWGNSHALFMARNLSQLAKLARQRYLTTNEDIEMAQSSTETVTAPPKAKIAKYLTDAEGNIYLWTPQLAARGDLVAGYDPDKPEAFEKDIDKIRLNHEIERAKEQAKMAEVAKVEAEKANLEAQEKAADLELQAKSAEARAKDAEAKLEEERADNAKKLAEMQAKLDALAKQSAEQPVVEKPAKSAPKKKQVEVKEQSTASEPDFSELDD